MNNKIITKSLKECLPQIVRQMQNKILIPVLGAGFSSGFHTGKKGTVPNGKQMREHMINTLLDGGCTTDLGDKTFAQIAKYYNRQIETDKRKKYISENFVNVTLGNSQKAFLQLNWPYIYTLNIDDAIENNSDYDAVPPNRKIDENATNYGKPVYKLHGNAKDIIYLEENAAFSVFDTSQYVSSLKENKWMLNKLKQDYIDKNILFLGCSLKDEIDLMHVFSLVKEKDPQLLTKKYYVTDNDLSREDLIDLEDYGISTVIKVGSFGEFYDEFLSIRDDLNSIVDDELSRFKNIPITQLGKGDASNEQYILYGKHLYDQKTNRINVPYFFTKRNLSGKILKELDQYPIQFVYGKRVSGKSYLLIDLIQRIKDRDRYYFDSRLRINSENIDMLANAKNTVVLIDTNVLSDRVLRHILELDTAKLHENSINFIICVNSSKKELMNELRYRKINKDNDIFFYSLENVFSSKFENDEYHRIKKRLLSLTLPYFARHKSIIDNLIHIQGELNGRGHKFLPNFDVDSNNYIHIAYLLLLANYGKVTSADMVKFNLTDEPYQLMPKLDKAVEPDYRFMIMSSPEENYYFQIVCNAPLWLLGYLSKISLRPSYKDAIVNAFKYIVEHIVDSSDRAYVKKNTLYKFIKFDNINFLLGGARKNDQPGGVKKLIQRIYDEIKPMIDDNYQFYHQYAKCLLWGVEALPEEERMHYLDEAIKSVTISRQMVEEIMYYNKQNKSLEISLAHIEFTASMIRVKMFYFNKNDISFEQAVKQLYKTLRFAENENAEELFDAETSDERDYSVSNFMDYLLSDASREFGTKLAKEASFITTYRIKSAKR